MLKQSFALVAILMGVISCSPGWTGPSNSEAKKLLKEFHKAQTSQLKALVHQQQLDLKELKTTLKTEFREVKAKEQAARKKYFEEHSKGPEKREYMKQFIARMKKLESDHAHALEDRKKSQRDAKEALQKEQNAKRLQFETALKGGTIPTDSLWPPKGQ